MTKNTDTTKPSQDIAEKIDREELRKELLGDMPKLRPAHRFRIAHRNAFQNLQLNAMKSGVFDSGDDDGTMSFDMSKPADIERLQRLNDFVAAIDEFAESIADNPERYARWAEGKDQETMLAIFTSYQEALGESKRS